MNALFSKKNLLAAVACGVSLTLSASLDVRFDILKTFVAPGEGNMCYVNVSNLGEKALIGLDFQIDLPNNMHYVGHSGPGDYDKKQTCWHLDRLAEGAHAQLGIMVLHDEPTEKAALRSSVHVGEDNVLEQNEIVVLSKHLLDFSQSSLDVHLAHSDEEDHHEVDAGIYLTTTNVGKGKIGASIASLGEVGSFLKIELEEKNPHRLDHSDSGERDPHDPFALFHPHDCADLRFDFDEGVYPRGIVDVSFMLFHHDHTSACNAFIVWGEAANGSIVHPLSSCPTKQDEEDEHQVSVTSRATQRRLVDGRVSYLFPQAVRSITLRYYNEHPSKVGNQELYISNLYIGSNEDFKEHLRFDEENDQRHIISLPQNEETEAARWIFMSSSEQSVDDAIHRIVTGAWQKYFSIDSLRADEIGGGQLADLSVEQKPIHGHVLISKKGKRISYYPEESFYGNDIFRLKAINEDGDEFFAKVHVRIANKPALEDQILDMVESQVISIDPFESLTPGDGAVSKFTIASPPLHGHARYDQRKKRIEYIPTRHYVGEDVLEVVVIDDNGLSDQATFRVNVRQADETRSGLVMHEVPRGQQGPASLERRVECEWEKRIPVESITHDELQGQKLKEVILSVKPKHGRVSISDKQKKISYYPEDGFTGQDTFVLEVTNEIGQNSPCNVAITILSAPEQVPMRNLEVVENACLSEGEGDSTEQSIETVTLKPQKNKIIYDRESKRFITGSGVCSAQAGSSLSVCEDEANLLTQASVAIKVEPLAKKTTDEIETERAIDLVERGEAESKWSKEGALVRRLRYKSLKEEVENRRSLEEYPNEEELCTPESSFVKEFRRKYCLLVCSDQEIT